MSLPKLLFQPVSAMFSDRPLSLVPFHPMQTRERKQPQGGFLCGLPSIELASMYSVIKVTGVEKAPSVRRLQCGRKTTHAATNHRKRALRISDPFPTAQEENLQDQKDEHR